MGRFPVSLGVALVGCALSLACGDSDPIGDPENSAEWVRVSSSSIVLDANEQRLWIASQDHERVIALDASSLDEVARFAVPGEPSRVAVAGPHVAATARLSTDLVVYDTRTADIHTIPLPCGGAHGVVFLVRAEDAWTSHAPVPSDRPALLVACPHDDRVLRVGADDTIEQVLIRGRPSEVAVDGTRAWVSLPGTGTVVEILFEGPVRTAATLRPPATHAPPRAASGLTPLAVDNRGQVAALFDRVDNDPPRDQPVERGGYGSVFDGDPRIAPSLFTPSCADTYARFDGGERVFSGPAALGSASSDTWWVVHRHTGNVAVVTCTPGQGARAVASWTIGLGGRGIAVAPGGRTAWVDVAFDGLVAELRWDGNGRWRQPPIRGVRLAQDLTPTLSVEARQGRRIFHDARNPQLTPSGVVACATCHPSGGDDGLRWFLHTPLVSARLRRTPVAWEVPRQSMALHWDAEFSDPDQLVRSTIRSLMNGLGLVVDARAVSHYMNENAAPPGRPLSDDERTVAAMGRRLFHGPIADCARCHGDNGLAPTGAFVVLPPSDDPHALRGPVRAPSLRAVRARAPYGHDGRAATLRSLWTDWNPEDTHGHTSQLQPAELDALLLYLETL